MTFIDELKCRRVFRVLGTYAVGSFVLLQIGDVAFEPLGLPAGSQRLLIVLLIGVIGLLIWDPVMPWDTASELSAEDASGPASGQVTPPDNSLVTEPAADASIAVLEFESLSPVAEDVYFAEGMAAEIQSVLARIPGIRTVAHSVSGQPDDAADDKLMLGKRLGVAYMLDGSVRKAGEDIRVMVQLVRAADARVVWSESYQRKFDDVFAIQDAIAETVAVRLQSTLYREGISARARARTDDLQAYNHYLTALYYRPDRWDLVAEYARRATEADPEFASARALLARAYMTRLGGKIPAAEAYPAARAEVEAALRLDPADPESLLMLGHLERVAGNYRQAESIYRNVKALAPNMVTTDLANLLQMVGRLDEALDEYEFSRRLDPDAGTTFYAMALLSAGHKAEVHDWLETALLVEQAPETEVYLRCFRAMLLAQEGDIARIEPLDALRATANSGASSTLGYLSYALA